MRPPAEHLTGDGVTLRRWLASDAEALDALIDENRAHLSPFMPWAAAQDYTQTVSFLARSDQGWANGTAFNYAVLAPGGELAGSFGLMDRAGPGTLEIGYWLSKRFTGRGLATRAVRALIAAAFALPGVERVEIVHDVANTRSGAVPARLGFTEIDRLQGDATASGEVGVDVIWQLTRP